MVRVAAVSSMKSRCEGFSSADLSRYLLRAWRFFASRRSEARSDFFYACSPSAGRHVPWWGGSPARLSLRRRHPQSPASCCRAWRPAVASPWSAARPVFDSGAEGRCVAERWSGCASSGRRDDKPSRPLPETSWQFLPTFPRAPGTPLVLNLVLAQGESSGHASLDVQPLHFFSEKDACRTLVTVARAWAARYPVPYASAHRIADEQLAGAPNFGRHDRAARKDGFDKIYELCWLNVFGPKLVECVGRERMLSTPAPSASV